MTPHDQPVAHLSGQTLDEVWNAPALKQMRLNMLSGKKTSSCTRCYELEASGFQTLRNSLNRDFVAHMPLVESTSDDGHVEKVNLPYFDIRFSNLCNFRCRSCGPQLSSGWYEDDAKLFGPSKDRKKVVTPTQDPEEFWQQVEPHIENLEQVYFAGGEPLFMPEHYRILERLLELKKTKVLLRYNTNFSITKFKQYDVFELWKRFERVEVGASLDAFGVRGEYMRKGQKWSQTVANRQRMIRECPHVSFFLSPTMSIMNAFQLPEFHRQWVDSGFINVDEFIINTLLEPPLFRIQILPEQMKRELEALYREHILYLEGMNSERAIEWYEGAIRFLWAEDQSHRLPEFLERTRLLDDIRGESIADACPELAVLLA